MVVVTGLGHVDDHGAVRRVRWRGQCYSDAQRRGQRWDEAGLLAQNPRLKKQESYTLRKIRERRTGLYAVGLHVQVIGAGAAAGASVGLTRHISPYTHACRFIFLYKQITSYEDIFLLFLLRRKLCV